ncbi:hypothetical protein AB4565_08085 [Vibrio breoganii]
MQYIFFSPSYTVGGVQTLFIRLANAFSNSHNIAYIDYKSGFSYGKLNSNIEHIEYVEHSRLKIPQNSILVIQANYATMPLNDIFEFSGNTRLFFWQLHPQNPYVSIPYSSKINLDSFLSRKLFNKQFKMIESVTEFAVKQGGYYAMDSSNVDSINFACPSLKIEMLPLYLGEPDDLNCDGINESCFSVDPVRLTWIGRLEKGFKTNILERVLSDASKLRGQVTIQIVGTGEGEEQIRRHSKVCGLEVDYYGSVDENELKTIIKKSDIVFAMGTSAIIAAREIVPTICLDFSYHKVPQSYRYRWLYESKGLSLGNSFKGNDFPKENTHSFEGVIQCIRGNKGEISRLCYDYVKKNYFLPSDYYYDLISRTQVNSFDLLKIQEENAKAMIIGKIRHQAFRLLDKLRQKNVK